MKKLHILTLTLILAVITIGCTENLRTKQFGGTMNITLPPATKLVNATWKEGQLWYLYRPMRTNESPETFEFREKSNFGMIEGIVIFKESR